MKTWMAVSVLAIAVPALLGNFLVLADKEMAAGRSERGLVEGIVGPKKHTFYPSRRLHRLPQDVLLKSLEKRSSQEDGVSKSLLNFSVFSQFFFSIFQFLKILL